MEYKVIVISADIESATRKLNNLAQEGWRVVSSTDGGRIILAREVK